MRWALFLIPNLQYTITKYEHKEKEMRIFLLLLLFGLHTPAVKAQHIKQRLYDNLSYSNGICLKKIEVSYLSLGRDILNENNDSIAIRIRTITKNTPYSSISFLYRGQKYYISVHQKCKTNNLSANEKITLYIQFYRDIKQPYQNKYPYAIITKIDKHLYLKKSTARSSALSKTY